MRKRLIFLFSFLVIFVIILIYTSRTSLITDDITPISSCPELIEKSDLLFVIPDYENNSLDKYPQWCAEMRSLNKTFALHGITHQYHEFNNNIDREELEEALTIFEQCFGYKPTLVRPPNNKISPENKELLESFNLTLYRDTYLLHPYCHCQPSGWMKPLNLIIGC